MPQLTTAPADIAPAKLTRVEPGFYRHEATGIVAWKDEAMGDWRVCNDENSLAFAYAHTLAEARRVVAAEVARRDREALEAREAFAADHPEAVIQHAERASCSTPEPGWSSQCRAIGCPGHWRTGLETEAEAREAYLAHQCAPAVELTEQRVEVKKRRTRVEVVDLLAWACFTVEARQKADARHERTEWATPNLVERLVAAGWVQGSADYPELTEEGYRVYRAARPVDRDDAADFSAIEQLVDGWFGRVVVIPCGGKKLDEAAPAGELYVGSYHRAARRAADALGGRVLILSALHGLVDLDTVLEPYDLRMGQPGSVAPERLAEQAVALGVADSLNVAVLAGKAYADAASSVWPHAVRPLDGTRGMGEQLARLAAIAAEAPSPSQKAIGQAQIGAWLDRHDIAIREMTEAEATRVAAAYHAAIEADRDAALLEDADRAAGRLLDEVLGADSPASLRDSFETLAAARDAETDEERRNQLAAALGLAYDRMVLAERFGVDTTGWSAEAISQRFAQEVAADNRRVVQEAQEAADAELRRVVFELIETGGACQYGAMCGRPAAKALTHPVLGLLAACEGCARIASR